MNPFKDPIKRAAHVRAELFTLGLRLSDVDKQHGLVKRSCAKALQQAHKAGEEALASALGLEPHQMFPERYDEAGRRLSPQPQANYENSATVAQRRKAVEV
ncbi:MAG: helix-turn-helix domain-containing protein [Pseudomonadota bacterium]